MSDLIDRQAAIEIAIEAADEWDGGTSFSRDGIIERRLKMIPAVHIADVGKKVERTAVSAQNTSSCAHENDLISRKAAIEALARMMPRSYTPDGSHPADEEIFRVQEVFADCIEALEILPSAQPATNCSEIPNGSDDTISRQAAIIALSHNKGGNDDADVVIQHDIETLKELPAAQTKLGKNTMPEQPKMDRLGVKTGETCTDVISRQAAIDCVTYDVEHTIECLKALPSVASSTAQTTETTAETTAPSTDDWIPVERELPEDLAEVNVTWVNPFAKSKPFTASAVYCEGNWYWYSSVCADVLAEYGRNDVDKVDDMIEITAWRPLPEPYRGGDA